MLVYTRKVEKHNLLGLYYTRNQVEEIFKNGRDAGKMFPICAESEETLRGHMLLTFISMLQGITDQQMRYLRKVVSGNTVLFKFGF